MNKDNKKGKMMNNWKFRQAIKTITKLNGIYRYNIGSKVPSRGWQRLAGTV
jgi:hypothetical protein